MGGVGGGGRDGGRGQRYRLCRSLLYIGVSSAQDEERGQASITSARQVWHAENANVGDRRDHGISRANQRAPFQA